MLETELKNGCDEGKPRAIRQRLLLLTDRDAHRHRQARGQVVYAGAGEQADECQHGTHNKHCEIYMPLYNLLSVNVFSIVHFLVFFIGCGVLLHNHWVFFLLLHFFSRAAAITCHRIMSEQSEKARKKMYISELLLLVTVDENHTCRYPDIKIYKKNKINRKQGK